MKELEPLLSNRTVLPASTAFRLRVHVNLGPLYGVLVKQLDMMMVKPGTANILLGLTDDPDLTNPSTIQDWLATAQIRPMRLVNVQAGAAGQLAAELVEPFVFPDPGVVFVDDYQVLMRLTAGAGVVTAFELWFKVVELDLGEWMYYNTRIRKG